MWDVLEAAVGIPMLALLIMTGMQSLVSTNTVWEQLTNVGWDMCILGVGVTGGLFVHPGMVSLYGATGALLTAIVVLLVNLGFGIFILHMKRKTTISRTVGTVCVLAGGLAVGLPSGLTFVR